MIDNDAMDDALANWRSMATLANKLSEDDLRKFLERERAGQARPTFMLKIYGRFAKVRAERERREFLTPKG